MKTILTRLFTVLMLMLFSMGVSAKVDVELNKEYKGGKVEVKSQEDNPDGSTLVTITVTPDQGFTITHSDKTKGVIVVAVRPTSSQSGTRALQIAGDLDVTDPTETVSYPNSVNYQFTVPAGLNAWVRDVLFQDNSRKGNPTDLDSSLPVNIDYSGTYYIATIGYDGNPENANNYYLCPTEGWISYKADDAWEEGDSNPFLTTYKCKSNAYHSGDPSNAVWIIEKHPEENYYYIKHKSSGQYMVSNGQISGTSNANRIRVHLETVAQDDLDDKALFYINPYSQTINSVVYSYLLISPKSEDGWNKNQTVDKRSQDLKWYTVNGGNQDALTGKGKDGGPNNTYKETGGVLGLYTEYDANAQFYFEDVITRPTITCNSSNQIEITAAQSETVTIKYTTNGSTPSATNGEAYSAPFDLAEGVTTIKAITIGTDWVSNVATFTSHKRLIQNQNNGWTIDENTTDLHFYMIPGDVASGITKVNTTSLFRPSMEWTFQSASVERGIQYYYIINNANSKYLCYDTTNSVYMDDFDSGDNKFKFFMVESSKYPGTFNIIPYGQNILVFKNNGNTTADVISTTANNTNINNISVNSLWKFILPSELDTNVPFTVSNTSVTKYYQIANVGNSGYYIVPPTGNNTNATTSNSTTDADVKRGSWYFEEAQAADASDWLTYYYIRNAVTGDYLYFTKNINNDGACLVMQSTIDSENADRYMFTWAKTADKNVNYYIIPKTLKDVSQNQFSALRKHDSNISIITNLTRDAGKYGWTFSPSSFTCAVPEVTYDEENDQIEFTSPNGADVYYNVNVDSEISSSNVTKYTVPIANNSSTQVIRAICARNGTLSDKSAVVIVIFSPTITLSEGASITYDALEHQPTITSAKIDDDTTIDESEYELGGYFNGSGETVTGCKDAGDYTVVLSNQDGGDYFVYGSTTFTITPATLTVTAEAKEKDYLDPVPELTFTAIGLQGTDEQADVLSGALACDVVSDVVGNTYPITQGSLNSVNNYIISYTGANLTITAKSIGSGITPAAGITIDDITKTGSAFSTPAIMHNNTPLILGTDYDDPITTSGDATTKYYNVTFTGIGNYTGSVTVRYANVTFGTKDNTDYSATFVTNSSGDSDFAKPVDITPYIITGVEEDGTSLTAVELDYIPENVPVVLMASSSATNGFSVKVRSGGDDATTDDNKLNVATGTDADRTFEAGEIYILYNGEFVLNASGTLEEGKVYLPKSAITGSTPAPARLLIRTRNGLSGIKDVDFSPLTTPNLNWYTLDGRRLSGKPTRKGIYLQNGQKVVVK